MLFGLTRQYQQELSDCGDLSKAVGETIKEESLKGKSCCSVSFTYGQCSSEVRSALHQQLTEWRYKIFSYHCDDVDGGWCGYRFDVSLEV